MKFIKILKDRVGENFILFKRDLKYLPKIFKNKPLLAYLGWVGFENLGDEILFIAHQRLFSAYELIPYHPKSLLGILTRINKRLFKGAILGGGTLINLPGVWLEGTRSMSTLGLPMFTFGTGVNFKFEDNTSKPILKNTPTNEWVELLNTFDYIGIRGPISKEILTNRLKKPVEDIGDTALALAPLVLPEHTEDARIGICIGHSKEIPLNVDAEEYSRIFVSFIKNNINKGFKVVLLPVYSKDISFNEKILKEVNDPNCKLLSVYNNYELYLQEALMCTVFIGQKLHGTISATLVRVPSIMISYHPKCFEYMKSVGMEECVISTETLTSALLEEKFSKIFENRVQIRTELEARVMHYRNLQYKKSEEIQKRLLS